MIDHDPLDALRDEDPLDSDADLTPGLYRVRSRLATTTAAGHSAAPTTRAAWLRPALAVAAPLAMVGVLAAAVLTGPLATPGTLPTSPSAVALASPTPHLGGLTSCVAMGDASSRMQRDAYFDGTVLRVSGSQVEFQVNRWFRGPGGDTATMTLTSGSGGSDLTDEGSPAMKVGQRWLVAGDDGLIWGCGFTVPYASH